MSDWHKNYLNDKQTIMDREQNQISLTKLLYSIDIVYQMIEWAHKQLWIENTAKYHFYAHINDRP